MGSTAAQAGFRQGEPDRNILTKTNPNTENEETIKWLRKHSSAINRT